MGNQNPSRSDSDSVRPTGGKRSPIGLVDHQVCCIKLSLNNVMRVDVNTKTPVVKFEVMDLSRRGSYYTGLRLDVGNQNDVVGDSSAHEHHLLAV